MMSKIMKIRKEAKQKEFYLKFYNNQTFNNLIRSRNPSKRIRKTTTTWSLRHSQNQWLSRMGNSEERTFNQRANQLKQEPYIQRAYKTEIFPSYYCINSSTRRFNISFIFIFIFISTNLSIIKKQTMYKRLNQKENIKQPKDKNEENIFQDNGSEGLDFTKINQEAACYAERMLNSNKHNLKNDKAPQYYDLEFGTNTLNIVDKKKFQMLKEANFGKAKRKNVKNAQIQYKQDHGWKHQTKSSKKLLSYHLFIQSLNSSLPSEYKKECMKKRTKIDTPASLLRNIKTQDHLREVISKAQQPFQKCIFEKYEQAKKIIKEQLLFKEYCFQIISYMHYIRLYIIFLLKQKVIVQISPLSIQQEGKLKTSIVCESLNEINCLETKQKQDDQVSLFRRVSEKSWFECQDHHNQNNLKIQNKKLTKRNWSQSIFLDQYYQQSAPIYNSENKQDSIFNLY